MGQAPTLVGAGRGEKHPFRRMQGREGVIAV